MMRVRSLRWTTFQLPFNHTFSTSSGAFACREGLILQLHTDTGMLGLGEASPLPEVGVDCLRETLAIMDAVGPSLIGLRLDEIETFWHGHLRWNRGALAAVRCAFDIAVCDVLARAAECTVAEFLAPGSRRVVAVNATIGASSTAVAAEAARQARATGFGCAKLKVGLANSIEAERERVAAVRDALGPQVKLRLDANGTWDPEQAIHTIRALEVYDLEFVEQPVRPSNLEGMKRVREAVTTPIAADEDITDLETARQVLQLGAADILVIKPMVVGGLRAARQLVHLAVAAGAAVVITTSLDTGVGAAAALHVAATLPYPRFSCGLATNSLLATDFLVRPLAVHCGQMELPDESGLGITLDERQLGQYCSCYREVS